MMKTVIMKSKIISILICIFFLSGCISKKISDYAIADMSFFVKDYLKEYSSKDKNHPLFAILITKNNQQNITISNLPEKAGLSYLLTREEKNYEAGMFSNTLCFYKKNEIGSSNHFFSEVPLKLHQKAMQKDTLIINNKELVLSNKLVDWNPSFIITYNLANNKKVIKDYR